VGGEESADWINGVPSGKMSVNLFLNVQRSVSYNVPKLVFSRGKGRRLISLIFFFFFPPPLYWYYLCQFVKGNKQQYLFLPKYTRASSSVALLVRVIISSCF